jgi:hypothetical protein
VSAKVQKKIAVYEFLEQKSTKKHEVKFHIFLAISDMASLFHQQAFSLIEKRLVATR